MDVIAWLLEGDPAIRWQVMADLTGAHPPEVGAERSRVAEVGWGARRLGAQDPDGKWGGGHYSPKWTSTTYTLRLLRHLGIDPLHPAVQRGIETLAGRAEWFDGGVSYVPSLREGEACVTGMTLALASYFGGFDSRRESMVGWLLGQQLEDGGWNCETRHGSTRSSFNTTILVLEGLLAFERTHPAGLVRTIQAARRLGHDYLLDRKMMRSLTTGEIIREPWTRFSFPPRWHYDVLRGLDYLQEAHVRPDDRVGEAIELVLSKQTKDGRWKLQNHHSGREHFKMEQTGQPSRWNTLRALRVLRWYGIE
jgi:hypothetical protein